MKYTNFQIYKPVNATEAKLYWSTQDNIDWVKAKEAIKDYNLPVVVYNHLTGKILEVNPPLDSIIPTGKSILITDLTKLPDANTILNECIVMNGEVIKVTREELIANKWKEIKDYRTKKIYDGAYIASVNNWVQTDMDTQQQIACIHQLVLAGVNPGTVKWKFMNNEMHDMTDTLVREILLAIFKQVQAIFTAAEYARMRLAITDDILNFEYKSSFPETYTKE